MSLDLEHHLVIYGAYHHNKVNITIHLICVPVIMISAFTMATYSGTLVALPSWLSVPYLELNLGTIAATLYSILYVLLEPVAGSVLALFCLGMTGLANYMRVHDPELTWKVALGAHIFSWVAQFVGHGVFEKRAPALVNNVLQALILAPIFVWLEILFALGYRPELQRRVEKQVKVKLEKLNTEGKNGKAQ